MSIINTGAKEIRCKILYYGPESAGKKSAIRHIRDRFEESKRKFCALPLEKELYSLVLSIGKIFGFQAFFHIYNLNNESKEDNKRLLKGADGVVFMASLDPPDREKNIRSFLEMESFLKGWKIDPFKLPMVLQYNKADLPSPQPIQNMRMDLNKYNNKDFKSSVLKGAAVLEPLKRVCKLALLSLKRLDF